MTELDPRLPEISKQGRHSRPAEPEDPDAVLSEVPEQGRHSSHEDEPAPGVLWLELPRRLDGGAHRRPGLIRRRSREDTPHRRIPHGGRTPALWLLGFVVLVGLCVVVSVPLYGRFSGPSAASTDSSSSTVPSVEPASAAPLPEQGLLWTGDAETGDLSQFAENPANNVGGIPPTVETDVVRDGRYAIVLGLKGATKSTDGICCGTRNELLPKFRDLKEGDDLWFGFSTYLAPGFPTDTGWQLITQFKENFDGSPPLGLYVEEGQYKVEGGYGYPGGSRLFINPLSPASTGQWVDWVWHVKFSSDPRLGFIELWQNGTLVQPRFAPPGGTLYPGTGDQAGGYVKTGPYRDPSVSEPATLYLDSWKIGTSRDVVQR